MDRRHNSGSEIAGQRYPPVLSNLKLTSHQRLKCSRSEQNDNLRLDKLNFSPNPWFTNIYLAPGGALMKASLAFPSGTRKETG